MKKLLLTPLEPFFETINLEPIAQVAYEEIVKSFSEGYVVTVQGIRNLCYKFFNTDYDTALCGKQILTTVFMETFQNAVIWMGSEQLAGILTKLMLNEEVGFSFVGKSRFEKEVVPFSHLVSIAWDCDMEKISKFTEPTWVPIVFGKKSV